MERNCEVDIESGCSISGDDSSEEPTSVVKKQVKTLLDKVSNRFSDGLTKGEEGLSSCDDLSSCDGVLVENVKEEKKKSDVEKTPPKEKRRRSSNKKPPKPPKPPTGPSLDAADQKLIREISELAKLKRARIERMKALKKMKATKQSSSSGNVMAMVFTLLFCLVIILQGMSSKGTPTNFQGSPVSAEPTKSELISVQFFGNPSATDVIGPGYDSSNFVAQVAGSEPQDNPNRAVG